LPSKRERQRFEDILNNIARIERFTAGFDYDAFAADERALFAVLHALLIISEAARKLEHQADRLAPEQPWPAIRTLGNVLRHEYDGVDTEIIWRIVCNDLPSLKRSVEQAISNLSSN
jgi:uncharacterized protein with HEPN domain